MDWKKVGKAVLFPPLAILLVLLPVSTVLLVYALIFMGTDSLIAILSYVLAFYTLTVWCFRLPRLIRAVGTFKAENRWARRWQDDAQLRINVTMYGTLVWNTAYALLQLGMGFWHHTFWFYSLAGYYLCLAVMRFFLARYVTKHRAGERMRKELIRYRLCGWIFLFMNLTLSLMVFFMVYWNRTFVHHEITTIALAAYTFTAFAMAIVNMVKYRRYNSPVYSASKAISFAAACVSMLTLESTMLTTFGDGSMDALTRKVLLGCTGGAVSVLVVTMALYMIVSSSKKLKAIS